MRFVALVAMVVAVGTFGCSATKAVAPAPRGPTGASGEPPPAKATSIAAEDEAKKDSQLESKPLLGGQDANESIGEGGLGLVGAGKGGGGMGDGIGLGGLGTLGHGAGTGTGQGYGAGSGGLGGRGSGSTGKVSAATATTTGAGLPPEVISTVVKRSFAQIRYCYDKAMTKDPTLAGRIALKFTIDGQGAVATASAGDTTIADADMVTCLLAVVKKMSFPAPENGGTMVVTYPFNFAPSDS